MSRQRHFPSRLFRDGNRAAACAAALVGSLCLASDCDQTSVGLIPISGCASVH
jgi:hypothetical protein